jgi:endonuclease I
MKHFFTFLTFLICINCFAQIPQGYYNNATGTGYTLKTQLFNIINTHTIVSYSPGLWNLYALSDVKADGKVWDIYTACSFTFGTGPGGNQDQGTGGTSECQYFNREHTFPKSWFGGVAGTAMYSDAFHVMPTDKKVNGLRGNYAYGVVGNNVTYASSNGCKIGNNIAPNGPSLVVFEPADEYKGDIARNYFYMATCYEDQIASWKNYNSNGTAFLDGTNTRVYELWSLNMLYGWHIADPVSRKEEDRNNAIYGVQGNRNPFIDHPEWVYTIWGSSLSNSNFNFLEVVSIYPNPTSNGSIAINTNSTIDAIQVISVNGQIINEIKNPVKLNETYALENLPKGFYLLKLTSNNTSVTKKISVN